MRFLERIRCAGPTNAAADTAFCLELFTQQLLLTEGRGDGSQLNHYVHRHHFYNVPTKSASFSTFLLHFVFFPSLIKALISELHIFSLSSALSFLLASLLPIILHTHSDIYSDERLLFHAASTHHEDSEYSTFMLIFTSPKEFEKVAAWFCSVSSTLSSQENYHLVSQVKPILELVHGQRMAWVRVFPHSGWKRALCPGQAACSRPFGVPSLKDVRTVQCALSAAPEQRGLQSKVSLLQCRRKSPHLRLCRWMACGLFLILDDYDVVSDFPCSWEQFTQSTHSWTYATMNKGTQRRKKDLTVEKERRKTLGKPKTEQQGLGNVHGQISWNWDDWSLLRLEFAVLKI